MSYSGYPNVVDFTKFLRNEGVDPLYLPDDYPSLLYAFNIALTFVNPVLACVPSLPGYWTIYAIAVYNLAADNLINYANDQPGRTYFKDKRTEFGVLSLVPGLVQTSSDEGTSVGYVIPEFAKNMTLGDLQNLKTPYGRAYMNIAQQYGSIWGIS